MDPVEHQEDHWPRTACLAMFLLFSILFFIFPSRTHTAMVKTRPMRRSRTKFHQLSNDDEEDMRNKTQFIVTVDFSEFGTVCPVIVTVQETTVYYPSEKPLWNGSRMLSLTASDVTVDLLSPERKSLPMSVSWPGSELTRVNWDISPGYSLSERIAVRLQYRAQSDVEAWPTDDCKDPQTMTWDPMTSLFDDNVNAITVIFNTPFPVRPCNNYSNLMIINNTQFTFIDVDPDDDVNLEFVPLKRPTPWVECHNVLPRGNVKETTQNVVLIGIAFAVVVVGLALVMVVMEWLKSLKCCQRGTPEVDEGFRNLSSNNSVLQDRQSQVNVDRK